MRRRQGALPPYLQRANFETVRANADRVDVLHARSPIICAAQPGASLDRYVLLDAQDWMNDAS